LKEFFKNMRFVLPVIAAIVLVSPAMAQKIGVVDFQRAVVDTAEFKKAYAELEAKYKPKQDALAKARQTLQDIQAQLQATQGQLSQAGAAELNAKGQRTQVTVDRLTQDLQEDFEADRDAALRVVTTRYADVLKKLATEKGLDVIADTSALHYFGPTLDVTAAAIAAYDAAHPVK
jgi:outer membrane protein